MNLISRYCAYFYAVLDISNMNAIYNILYEGPKTITHYFD